MSMGKYELVCQEDGEVFEDGYGLFCPSGHKGLMRTRYEVREFSPRPCKGIFKFYDWLPVRSVYETDSCPVVFRSEKLSKELGLNDLWVGLTGYYPERDCRSMSCTFKEMEAYPTYARLRDSGGKTIVLASAGNTARAFAQIAAETGNRCIIVVPETSADKLTVTERSENVTLITVKGDYADAIALVDRVVALGDFVSEGGARNVARRDGMGTVMLQFAQTAGRLPDSYFQGVGSGTGGISAWEASLRLIGDGRFGDRLPRLRLSQNLPFTPMAKAWNAGRREILPEDLGKEREDVSQVYAEVLTNRKPPYSMKGGVFDAMTACDGSFIEVTNDEARSAERMWMQCENVRPDPAASVALASLVKAVGDGTVDRDECVFLNMTGAGRDRVSEDYDLVTVAPKADVDTDVTDEELRAIVDA